jgi:hypothetical protein
MIMMNSNKNSIVQEPSPLAKRQKTSTTMSMNSEEENAYTIDDLNEERLVEIEQDHVKLEKFVKSIQTVVDDVEAGRSQMTIKIFELGKLVERAKSHLEALQKGTGKSQLFQPNSARTEHTSAAFKVEHKRHADIVALTGEFGRPTTVFKDLVVKHPKDVTLPPKDEYPPFTSEEGWLDTTVETVFSRLSEQDSTAERVPPMALVRCSRGGKTRALCEIAHALKAKQPELCVIYVTLNDFSELTDCEQNDPITALCRRIAFAARRDFDWKESLNQFATWMETTVSPNVIERWLGDSPCVLLIDELNNLESLELQGDNGARLCSRFLKSNFLSKENRYMVFSSHVVTTTTQLSSFM